MILFPSLFNSTAGKRAIVQPVDIDKLTSQRFETHALQVTRYPVRLPSNHSRGAHLCIIFLQDAPTTACGGASQIRAHQRAACAAANLAIGTLHPNL